MSASATTSQKARVDDEDLDDLDDVLDQFNATPPVTKAAPAPTTSLPAKSSAPTPAPPSTATLPKSIPGPAEAVGGDEADDDEIANEFALELQRGMESLMREMGGLVPPSGASLAGADGNVLSGLGVDKDGKPVSNEDLEKLKEQERVFKAAWEAMLVEGMDGMVGSDLKTEEYKPGASGSSLLGAEGGEKGLPAWAAGAPAAGKRKAAAGATGKQDFRAGIKATMDKLKLSETSLKDSSASAPTDPFEALLAQLSESGLGELANGEGGDDEGLQGILAQMMGSLMSKEVLYEPLKELGDKFPPYLNEHAATTSTEDKKRYDGQLTVIKKIVAVFEDPAYKDTDKAMNEKVVDLMTEMQAFGSPPAELMGDMPPGFNLGADGMPEMPEGCCIS